MKIVGIGIDIVKNKRIRLSIKKKNFVNRTFGKNEIFISRNLPNKTNYFSKRFAAKEAFAKALGTGFRNNLNFKDIEIYNDKLGKPFYSINPKIKRMIKEQKKIKRFNIFLSIADEKDHSVAFTIIQKI